jgi:hypothetical protein
MNPEGAMERVAGLCLLSKLVHWRRGQDVLRPPQCRLTRSRSRRPSERRSRLRAAADRLGGASCAAAQPCRVDSLCHMSKLVGCLLVLALVGCAGTPVQGNGGTPVQSAQPSPATAPADAVRRLLGSLADCKTADEIRTQLAAGLEERELQHVGFDQVTIAQCIDSVAQAVLDLRDRPGDQLVFRQLADSVDLYHSAWREAMVRRRAGAASCLPTIR